MQQIDILGQNHLHLSLKYVAKLRCCISSSFIHIVELLFAKINKALNTNETIQISPNQ